MPKYTAINPQEYNLGRFHGPMGVWMGASTEEWCAVDETQIDGAIPVYFLESHRCFDREGIYDDVNNNAFLDNPGRFAFFTHAALQLCKDIRFAPDILHAHDWQTALAAPYLKIWHWNAPVLGKAASLLTIHNIDHQGKYGAEHYEYTGLQWGNFTSDKFEEHGAINFLKGGIHYADMVNTVSPTYAEETRSTALGRGMEPYLNDKGEYYIGVLNGVDYTEWNPKDDVLIPANYSVENMQGKVKCKAELQKRFDLEVNENIPLIGVVSRFDEQKGLGLLYDSIAEIIRDMVVQFVILGSGDIDLQSKYFALPAQYPGKIGSYIGYDNERAHWIEAGSDFFIMPSMYEPCGLNQMYSLRYGTLPIVRATGGLADTVEQYDEQTGEGTGFKLWHASPRAIYDTVGWAVSTYYDRKAHFQKMIARAMNKRFSWQDSAEDYLKAYYKAIERKKSL